MLTLRDVLGGQDAPWARVGARGLLAALAAGLLVALPSSGCLTDEPASGLRRTPPGPGPRVVFRLDGSPYPDLPFPNDLLTRPDATARTGRRLNLPADARVAHVRTMRTRLLAEDGFGTTGPISVRFDAPLDLDALSGRGRALGDDPVLLLDLSPGESFGTRVPLDLDRGHHPLLAGDPSGYFDADPHAGESNVVFETVDEDLDLDGRLGPLEDRDADGLLDRPNVWPPGGDPVADLLTAYERETDTLILRPLLPLRPERTYAVVLTEALRGRDGAPVRSPFAFVHHTRQTAALAGLPNALAKQGRRVEDVAFAWVFSTQSATAELTDLRDGLDGRGPFAGLAEAYPPDVSRVEPLRSALAAGAALLTTEDLQSAVAALGPLYFPPESVDALTGSFAAVEFLVAGRFVTPNLLIDNGAGSEDGVAQPGDEDEVFRLDPVRGEVVAGTAEVPFWCTVPRSQAPHTGGPDVLISRGPQPVVVFAHDLGRGRAQSLAWAGTFAAQGVVTCAIDAVGHASFLDAASEASAIRRLSDLNLEGLRAVLFGSRSRDLDHDGRTEPPGDFFGLDPFHGRDTIRQTVVDHLQFLRVLRAFDGTRRWSLGGIGSQLAGDFNGDGAVDFGGPDAEYHLLGVGVGGAVAVITGALDQGVESVIPVSSGGGLMDVATRSAMTAIRKPLFSALLGPLVVGHPSPSGFTSVSFIHADAQGVISRNEARGRGVPFAELPPLVPGDRVVLTNERTGEQQPGVVGRDGSFRVGVAADAATPAELRRQLGLEPWRAIDDGDGRRQPPSAPRLPDTARFGDRLRLEVLDATGRTRNVVRRFERDVTWRGVIYPAGKPLVALSAGFGLRRQTPTLRRTLELLHTVYASADPLSYAHLLRADTEERRSPRLLVLATAGDREWPVSSAYALARAAGLISPDDPGWARLLDAGVVEGTAWARPLVDPDGLSGGADGWELLDPPVRAERAGGGVRVVPVHAEGGHGIAPARPGLEWDGQGCLAALATYFISEGRIADDACAP